MPIVLKSGNLNLLEPSGPVQACNGIALPFTVLHCNGNIILEKPLDFMHCMASSFGYPNYRWSQFVRIIDVLLYLTSHNKQNKHKSLADQTDTYSSFMTTIESVTIEG